MSRRPTRPPSRSLSAATARAFRSLGCTGEGALDVLTEATQPQPRLHAGASSAESRPHDDAPPAASSRPTDAASEAPEPSVEHPAPPASALRTLSWGRGGSSSPDEPSIEASSTPVVPRPSPPASPSSASSSSKRKRVSSPRSSTEAATASQIPPFKRLGCASADLRARAAAVAAQRASGPPSEWSTTPAASHTPSPALGSPGGESSEGSDVPLIPVSSPSPASPPSPAASALVGVTLPVMLVSLGRRMVACHQAVVMVVVRRRRALTMTRPPTDHQGNPMTPPPRPTPTDLLRRRLLAYSNRRRRRRSSTTYPRSRSNESCSGRKVKMKAPPSRLGLLPKLRSRLQRRHRGLLHPMHHLPRVRLLLRGRGVPESR
ncbi:hypothetical protein PR001_g16023 [Phytophthora rubi]|uniref:Uncharacterized protein n=1 Tax=Phytophthora rubi TaxID=129364 RepID=A0A6A3KUN3_9STRA|nr:hypothetical protein PR001_g16023 [Phytophthora rubi]